MHRILLLGTFLPWCWLGMQVVHESGHVLGAVATGGTVARVVLHPLAISRTDLARNPYPLVVAWSGPLVGIAVPLILAGAAGRVPMPGWYLFRFFAGFCLIANGVYISVGSLSAIGDAGDMVRHGSPVWVLWLFGLLTAPGGLVLWNGLGPHFGIGKDRREVGRSVAYISCGLLLATLGLEIAFSSR